MNKNELEEFLNNRIENKKVENTLLFYGENIDEFKNIIFKFIKTLLCDMHDEQNLDNIVNPDIYILKAGEIIEKNGLENKKIQKVKVQEVKEFFKNILAKPINDSVNKKVYIIENANYLSNIAQNAILKTIEEPPKFAYVFLLSKSIDEILPTIKSRCTKIYLKTEAEYFNEYQNNMFLENNHSDEIINIFNNAKKLSKLDFFSKYTKIFEKEDLEYILINLENILGKYVSEYKILGCYQDILKAKKQISKNVNKKIIRTELLFNIYAQVNGEERSF